MVDALSLLEEIGVEKLAGEFQQRLKPEDMYYTVSSKQGD